MLVGILALSGVAALTLLIFIFLTLFDLFEKITETKKTSERVFALNRSKPAPCRENEELIKSDIAVLDKAIKGLRGGFDLPLQTAVDEFIRVLEPPVIASSTNPIGLNEEEYESFRYVYPGEDEMDSEKREKLPKKARKLSLEDFKKLYSGRFEREFGDNPTKNMLSAQEFFIERFNKIFPNWDEALKAFVNKARPLTVEPIVNVNDESVLLSAMGFPRALPLPQAFARQMEEYTAALQKIVEFEVERKMKLAKDAVDKAAEAKDAEGQLESAREIEKEAEAAKAEAGKDQSEVAVEKRKIAEEDAENAVKTRVEAEKTLLDKVAAAKAAAAKADENGVEAKVFENPEEVFFIAPGVLNFMGTAGAKYSSADVREVYFQRDVLGNLLFHVVKSGVKAMHGIVVRNFSESLEDGRIYGNYRESIGDFDICHYTIEVSGSLAAIRKLCASLDESYKVKRFYIVRAVTLYAEENSAAVLMGQKTTLNAAKNNQSNEEPRGRRRRRQQSEEPAEVEKDALQKAQEQNELLPPHKRSGYGEVLIGKNNYCRAMIDIDYILPQQKQ